MSFYSGKDGSLYVGETRVARVSNWSLSTSVEALEVTDLGQNERTYTPGLKSATGSSVIFYYDDAPAVLISKVIKTGPATEDDVVRLSLRWGDKKVDVNAYITKADISCQVGSVMQANINFTVTGNYQEVVL